LGSCEFKCVAIYKIYKFKMLLVIQMKRYWQCLNSCSKCPSFADTHAQLTMMHTLLAECTGNDALVMPRQIHSNIYYLFI